MSDLPKFDPELPKEQQGLFEKYNVNRLDGKDRPGGKHEKCELFTLDITHDPHARPALLAYINSVRTTHPNLALDMALRYGINPVEFPESTRVHRSGDMAPKDDTRLCVILDNDYDVIVSVSSLTSGEYKSADVEFCTYHGGGKSPKTRAALIKLMCAMEEDNKSGY